MTENVPAPDEREFAEIAGQLEALAAALRPFQRSVHAWMRRYGRYEVIDRVLRDSPQARPFVLAALLSHVHSEAAEAFEEVRDMPARSQTAPAPGTVDDFAIELADVLLALADLAEFAGRDLGAALQAKIANERRDPHRPRGF